MGDRNLLTRLGVWKMNMNLTNFITRIGLKLTGREPVSFALAPEWWAIPQTCHENAKAKARKDGGKAITGYVFFVNQFLPVIDSIFHSLWENDKGELIDITPRPRASVVYQESFLFSPIPMLPFPNERLNYFFGYTKEAKRLPAS
jgi:hypothetical protein